MERYWDICPVCYSKSLVDSKDAESPAEGADVICENKECGNTGIVVYICDEDDHFCQWENE